MTDNARIVREALERIAQKAEFGPDYIKDREADKYQATFRVGLAREALSALDRLETELATAKAREAGLTKALAEVQADLERAREEGSRLLAEVFNQLTTEQKNAAPGEVAEQIGRFMVDNGYRLVFTRWYLQAPPRAALAPEQKGE